MGSTSRPSSTPPIAGFVRSGSGKLDYLGCLSGEEPSDDACGLIPSAVVTLGGNNSGLAAPSGLAFAGNAHLYVSLQSDHGDRPPRARSAIERLRLPRVHHG